LGDRDVTLADLNTENQSVIDTFNSWIHDTVMKYGVDGLRLDTAKHGKLHLFLMIFIYHFRSTQGILEWIPPECKRLGHW